MRARLIGPALLSLVVGACGSAVPAPTAPLSSTAAPTVSTLSVPAPTVSMSTTPAPTDLDADIDVGGRTMHLVCVGPSDVHEPTILLESGFGDDHHPWDEVVRGIEPEHRVCSYDRAGLGHSQPRTEPSVTAADHAADLRALLGAAKLEGPFVIGAHSYGAEVAILFTQAAPDDVAGLLFVDPRAPGVSARWRAVLPDVTDDEPDGLVQLRYSLDAMETDPVLNRENLDLHQSFEEAAAALDAPGPFFGDRPVVVLSAGESSGVQLGLPQDLAITIDEIWTASHQELADESTAGSLEVVPGSGHYIQTDRPQAVIDGLERILGDLATPYLRPERRCAVVTDTRAMPLEEYRRKRDFGKTPEPAPGHVAAGTGAGGRRRFVVQRHRATRLHYDFRLEVDGVLVSWAVPKGPTLDNAIRRMAVHVEDHPMEYFDFEGVIPARQYGAGDVTVWDWGTWEPEAETPDPRQAITDGELKFRIQGEKLKGRYTIVRTSRRPGSEPRTAFEDDEGEQWLLLHKRDEFATTGWDAEDHPQSVKSGRTNDEVKANAPAIWVSGMPAATAEIDLAGARDAPMPRYLEPMKATLTTKAFRDEDWLFEVKWDGYRVEAVIRDGKVSIFTRNGHDAEVYFPRLLTPPTWIDAREAIVDGEVVALDERGRPDFGLLQERISLGRTGKPVPLVFQAFDLLYHDGRSLLDVPLEARKRLLQLVVHPTSRVQLAQPIETEGIAFFEAVKAQELEGIVAKHRRSRYEPGRRSPAWLKIKARPEQELVVGGWTPGEGAAKELGAVVVGVYDGERLRFAGKVGSGFDGRTRKELRARLEALEADAPPFDPPPAPEYRGRWGGDLAGVRWIRPELVIRAELGGWTRDGHVRQTSFKGIEPGRDAREVIRERAVDPASAERDAEASSVVAKAVAPAMSNGGGSEAMAKTTKAATSKAPAKTGTKAGKGATAAKAASVDPTWLVSRAELDALGRLGNEGTWTVAGQDLKLTNLDKVLFPPRDGRDEEPQTKRDLIAYFARIAPAMLPHLVGRPLNLQRFPNGAGAQGFWQKDIPATSPKWLTIWHETGFREREDRAANDHLVADRAASLCWLGNQASFEIHAWTSTVDEPWTPTFALIDIDPGTSTTWAETLTIARLYRTALEHLGVRAYPKLTGSRGIQAWIPIERGRYDYHATSDWVEKLSRAVGASVPQLVSWEWAKKERGGKARLDYTQNAAIKTLVAPYAVRPRAGAPVSAPIRWEELDDPDLAPDRWTIRDLPARVAEIGDLWAGLQGDAQVLPNL